MDVLERLRSRMSDQKLDAVVCISPENFAYTAGFVVPSQPLMRWRHAINVIHADGNLGIVCVDMEESTVRSAIEDAEVRVWREFIDRPMAVLGQMLLDWGLGGSNVGIELAYLPASDHKELIEYVPNISLVASDSILASTRQVKSPGELELLERLARISDSAIRTSFEAVSAGCSEMDIASALTDSIYQQGAEQFKLMIVATGERSELPNVGPTNRILKPGDICRVEIFSVIGGYHAGICRTAVVGEASQEAERIYRNLVECKHAVLNVIRPGVSTRSVYETYRETFNALEMPAISFVAHSIGVNLHEPPYFGPYSDQIIEEGMVLGMEPLVYRTGLGFGMQIKDMVTVENGKARLLSVITDTESLFKIEA